MKINAQCVLKNLKHDYKEVFTICCIIGGICILIILGIVAAFSVLPLLPLLSAYVLLNVIAAIIVLIFTIGIGIFGNKEWFEYKSWKEGYGWGHNDLEPKGSGVFLFPSLSIGVILYLLYFIAAMGKEWEPPTVSAIVFIVLILVGTPIGCAIARCKEEGSK